MKVKINKKIALYLLSVGVLRLLFIAVMILSITHVHHRNTQKVISAQRLKNKVLAAKTEYRSSSIWVKKANLSPIPIKKADLSSISGKKAERFLHPIVIKTAGRYQIDPALVKAIIMAESGYNTRAISKKGAKGLMQLMPATARSLGVEDIFNPEQNISGGVRYFKQLVNQFNGDVELALAAYNAGSRYVRQYQGIPPFKATRYYIKKVFKYYQIYKNQMAYNEKDIVSLNNDKQLS
ncbi:MAG: lytic transglycosylase domain-containing protein [Desulfobacterales bacterium]|jgi:soluble lytic murein transglycosylase-like protein